jgi:hypothetical protein
MTADIVNLNKVRKAKARADMRKQAERNRAASGRPKHERERTAAEQELASRRLDGSERTKPESDA